MFYIRALFNYLHLIFKDKTPIRVVVTDNSWGAFGTPDARGRYLYAILEREGGINESVPPGEYHFNVTFKMTWTGLKAVTTLFPIE